jgi:CBS domain containing-hemolysin-like protein
METIDYIIVILSLGFSAFFSGMEIAYLSANKLKLELDIKRNTISSRVLAKLVNKPSQYISTILLGNNIALVIYGIFMANVIMNYMPGFVKGEFAILLFQTVVSTIVIIIFAEFLPKTLFRTISNRALHAFAIPLIGFFYVFRPFVRFMILLSELILRKVFGFKIDGDAGEKAFGKIDIVDIIESSQSGLDEAVSSQEIKMIQNALDFSKVKLRECIVPRRDLKAVPYESTIEEVIDEFIATGFSNILVYKENIDEIIGYINVKDVFKNPQSLRAILRQVTIVPETMSAKGLLEQLIENNRSIAVVVDEFGVTGGIVTIEDIVEEIFGDIEDEHDSPDFNAKITEEGNYLFAGRNEVDLINDEFDLELSESDDYETIAGYILYHYGSFPTEGEIIEIADSDKTLKFKIVKIQDTKIEKLLLYKD